jgi:hypothetical protein
MVAGLDLLQKVLNFARSIRGSQGRGVLPMISALE